jgi:hypothetical protein
MRSTTAAAPATFRRAAAGPAARHPAASAEVLPGGEVKVARRFACNEAEGAILINVNKMFQIYLYKILAISQFNHDYASNNWQ